MEEKSPEMETAEAVLENILDQAYEMGNACPESIARADMGKVSLDFDFDPKTKMRLYRIVVNGKRFAVNASLSPL
jgi:hypothetical protein